MKVAVLLLLLIKCQSLAAFSVDTIKSGRGRRRGFLLVPSQQLFVSSEPSTSSTASETALLQQEGAASCLITFNKHRPMGCTVEESLADGGTVFISAITPKGNAALAGLQVGDVILAVSGIFGDMENVSGVGLAKV